MANVAHPIDAALDHQVEFARLTSDAEVADGIRDAIDSTVPLSDAANAVVAQAFRVASDHPEWTHTPLAAWHASNVLVRWPRAADAHKDGASFSEVEDRFAVSQSTLRRYLQDLQRGEELLRGRPRESSHAQIRLDSRTLTPTELAGRHGCSVRTVQRALRAAKSSTQPFIDRLDVVEEGESLRATWLRYLEQLASLGTSIAELAEPAWPAQPSRRALAAAGITYRFQSNGIPLPEWLDNPRLISPVEVCPTPQFAHIQKPLTPPEVARYNVVCDEASFHSV